MPNDPDKTIPIDPIEDRSLITCIEEGSISQFNFEHQPQVGCVIEKPPMCVLTVRAAKSFNPPAEEVIRKIKIGDMIHTSTDTESELWKEFDPPEEYQLPYGFSNTFTVVEVTPDLEGLPVVIAIVSK